MSLMFVCRKSKAISKPIGFSATALKARAPSCFSMPDVGLMVIFKYLRKQKKKQKKNENHLIS